MKRRTLITALGTAALTAHPALRAQGAFPQKPITLVVPSAPGGTTDFTARLIGEGLSRALGQPVVIDNKAGGAGNIGNQFVAKSRPDGHTLLVAYSGYQVGNPHLFANAGWDPIKDFAPVAMLTRAPQVIVVNASLKANTLAELVTFAKANPGKLNYASSGNGSIQHIAGELFKQLTGTFITHIPYRGAGPAVQDLIGGQVDLFMTTPASVVQHVKSGKLKALAVSSTTRLTALPQVPTAVEAGLKGFTLDSWFALYGPAGLSTDVVQRLSTEIEKILAMPDIKRRAEEAGTSVELMSPSQLGDYTRKELDHWGKVIKSSRITAEWREPRRHVDVFIVRVNEVHLDATAIAAGPALAAGQISGAGFDVVASGPPAPDHPFMTLKHRPDFILTPHVAWASDEAAQALADPVIDNVKAFERGAPVNVVGG